MSKERLEARTARLIETLRAQPGGFDTALIVGRINQYWLTGTMQDGLLVLRSDGSVRFFVRKSLERAKRESPLECLCRMSSYRDILAELPPELGRTYVETEMMPVAMLDRIRKYLRPSEVLPLDRIMLGLRSVKEPEELELVAEAGRRHRDLMERVVPSLLREGMSEADLVLDIYSAMVKGGHHGVTRFGMFQMEMVVGQVGFGESSIHPTSFDGPGGMVGLHPAVPVLGSRERRLERGDLVFADVGFGVLGYHSDKTQVYSFGAPPSDRAREVHAACRGVLAKAASRLKTGTAASEVYAHAMSDLPACLSKHFMGYGDEGVKFLGHGVGLQIDEQPVIMAANPGKLLQNMVVALEPKCGVEGEGMVGVEETYLVTEDGPHCLTGGDREVLVVA